jgi:rod shape-determining protein MreC
MVKRQVGSLAWFMTPFRAWNQRMTLALLGAAAIALLAIEKTNPEVAESARGAAADVIAPILDLLSRPSASAAQAIDSVRELGRLREENTRLKQQQVVLLQWQATGLRLDRENQDLRKLLNLAPDPKARFVTARVVGGSGGAFVRSILVAAGSKDGVRKNQAAITGEGLIGRVSEVGERASRVLLLTDVNSNIPVFVERTRERAIAHGDSSNSMVLKYVPGDLAATVGDRIVTSGHGGVFPPGLPVGVIAAVQGGTVTVQPFVDWEQVEYVRLVDYELSGLLLPMAGQEQPKGPR